MNGYEFLRAMSPGETFTIKDTTFYKGAWDIFTAVVDDHKVRLALYRSLDGVYEGIGYDAAESLGFLSSKHLVESLAIPSMPGYDAIKAVSWEREDLYWKAGWVPSPNADIHMLVAERHTLRGYILRRNSNRILTGPMIEIGGYKLHINDLHKSPAALADAGYELVSIDGTTVTLRKVFEEC